jgi:hypothetical protein
MQLRNGSFFIISVAEELEAYYIEDSRFEVFYLIKKALFYLNSINNSLSLGLPPPQLNSIRSEEWNLFVKS